MDSKQFRVLIYHCFLMKKNTVQAQQWLEKCYGDSALSKTTICRWYAEFKRVVDSERCLELFRRNKPNFLHRYVTMDETWIHHYTPESKRSSADWTAVDEKRPKRPKTQMWAGKVRPQYFGMLMEFCSSTTLKNVRRSIANVTLAN